MEGNFNLTDIKSESLSEFNLVPNSELTIGTEENLEGQQGGFFWSSNAKTTNKNVFEAMKQKDFDSVIDMVNQNMVSNYGETDANGNTLLHILAASYSAHPGFEGTVDSILGQNNSSNFINIQNQQGDTPMHIAVKSGNNEMAQKLDSAGANMTIPNKDGFKILAETVDSEYAGSPTLSEKLRNAANEGTAVNSEKSIEKIVGNFVKSPNSANDEVNTEVFLSNLMNKYSSLKGGADDCECDCPCHSGGGSGGAIGGADCDCDCPCLKGGNVTNPTACGCECPCHRGGGVGGLCEKCGCYNMPALNGGMNTEITEEFLETMLYKLNGGKRKSKDRSGRRRLNKGEKDVNSSRANQLGRMISNQASEIHKRVLKKIMKLLKLKEDDEEAENIARNYKAVLWRMVREEAKETDSNLDLAINLEKKTTKKVLDTIDPKEGEKLREESRRRRQERREKMIAAKKKKKAVVEKKVVSETTETSEELSATSDNKVPEGVYSQTSFSEDLGLDNLNFSSTS